MATHIRTRRDTTLNWAAHNPVLQLGEMGYDTDLHKFKVGDGTSTWSLLPWSPPDIDISGKVDKIEGMGLSTEDYTTAEKEKLANLSEGGGGGFSYMPGGW